MPGALSAPLALAAVPPDEALLDALVRRAAAGEREAFEELYALLADDLYAFARGHLHDDGLAEDVVAEAFLRAWRFLPRYRAGSNSFRPWIFAIVRNQVRDAWKRSRLHLVPLEGDIAAAGEPSRDPAETRRIVRAALRQLTPEQRDVVILRYFGGKSHAEIARLLGKREGAVRATLLRALRSMRKAVGDVAV